MKAVSFIRPSFLLIGAALVAAPALGANCEDMARLTIPNARIDSAQLVAAGAFTPRLRASGQPLNQTVSHRKAADAVPAGPVARQPPRRPIPISRCRRFVASRSRRSRRAIPTSRSKSGCRRTDGTANSRALAMAAGQGSSATPRWPPRSRTATPPQVQIPVTSATRRRLPPVIPRRWSTWGTAPSTR